MANTIVQIDLPESLVPTLALLSTTEGGMVAPNAAGYAMSAGASPWQYSITVPEACIGIYRVTIQDGDGSTVGQAWVWIEADSTATFIADGSYSAVASRKQLRRASQKPVSGAAYSFFYYNEAGAVWNGSAYVTWNDVDYATYRVTATEVGTSGNYTGTAPAGAARYELRANGASLAESYVVMKGRLVTSVTVSRAGKTSIAYTETRTQSE